MALDAAQAAALSRARHGRRHRARAAPGTRTGGSERRSAKRAGAAVARERAAQHRVEAADVTSLRASAAASHDARARQACAAPSRARIREQGLERVRIGWCDLHGVLRGKTLVAGAARRRAARRRRHGQHADAEGHLGPHRVQACSSPGGDDALPGFGYRQQPAAAAGPGQLPRAAVGATRTGWLRGQPWFDDGTPVPIDTRRVLQRALERLARRRLRR